MAPLVRAIEERPGLKSTVCVTAQHRQMLDQVLSLFEIVPDIDLDLMRPGQDLFDLTAAILVKMRDVLRKTRPDAVLVQGDTTTTFASALAAFYESIPVGHVEAGLRTWNLKAPFPEEANRCLTSRLASFHFCPTEKNAKNLREEGINPKAIHVTGNTVIDALLWVRDKIAETAPEAWKEDWGDARDALEGTAPIILITGHRRENFGQGVKDFCEALKQIARRNPEIHLVYPVHLNPNIKGPVAEILKNQKNIHLISPLDYAPFVYLMNRSRIILTDSGGVQEEAPSLGKPVLVMREATERPEAVDAGTVKLVGTDTRKIVENAEALLSDGELFKRMARAVNPYGDGKASARIAGFLEKLGKQ